MLSLSNGSLSNGNSNKAPLENGCCTTSGVHPKYKKRKVSAVRDFPPGCGRKAQPINPQDAKAVARIGDEENSVAEEKTLNIPASDYIKASETGNESLIPQPVKSPESSELLASLDDLVGKVVAVAGTVVGIESPPIVEPLESGLPKSLENNLPEVSRELHEVEVPAVMKSEDVSESKTVLESGYMANEMVPSDGAKAWSKPQRPICDAIASKENALINKCRRRKVSAVRDFPLFCGRNAPSPTEEERQRILLINGTLDAPVEAAVQGGLLRETVTAEEGGGPVRDAAKTFIEELNRDIQEGNAKKRDAPVEAALQGGLLRETVTAEEGSGPVRDAAKTFIEELNRDIQEGNAKKRELKGIVPEQKTDSHKASVQGRSFIETMRDDVEGIPVRERPKAEVAVLDGEVQCRNNQKRKLEASVPKPKTKSQKVIKEDSENVSSIAGETGKEIVVYSHDTSIKNRPPYDVALGCEVDKVIVLGLMAAANCPWRRGKGAIETSPGGMRTSSKVRRHNVNRVTGKGKSKSISRENAPEADYLGGRSKKKKLLPSGKAAIENRGAQVDTSEVDFGIQDEDEDSSVGQTPRDFEVILPPFGPNSSSLGDVRNKVRETLRLFQAVCRKLLQGEEAKLRQGHSSKRIDLQAAQIIRAKGKEVNMGKHIIGSVPGVEVGDEFQYRVELALVGIHRLYQAGIDYMKHDRKIIAASIVASGGYADDLDNPDVLIYSGQGGNIISKDKQPQDQKLERGNLALKNSISTKNPVRVIRGSKETKASASTSDARGKVVVTYTYDGLYTVERYYHDVGAHGKLVFKFELKRIPGQPELAWKEVKKSKKFKIREGLCVDDISEGKELFPICAVNTIDNEKPPKFNYITEMKYPDWYCPTPPKGCDCVGGCTDSQKCSCVVKNGGEIPYNYNGAIVEAKPLVYECGPSCKCPPSCYNRVSQHGMKIQLEIFKTKSRGWGVRSLTSIPSGSFICEYIGELLEDREAEQSQNDEYLFDIGQNYSDCSLSGGLSSLKPNAQLSSNEVPEDGGFTIDAAEYGNVGRFINHSCSPNLYAQNVLYDHEDKRMPHIMLFAAENIPPLQELTYHYNYLVDQIQDSNGNVKMKNCYCGSTECVGRMY